MVLVAVVLVAGCASASGDTSEGRLQIVTTVAPITSIVAAVAGDAADVRGLVPEGTNSHTFEPPPSAARTLARADVIFVNGLKLEEPTVDLAEGSRKKGSELVELGNRVVTPSQYIGPLMQLSTDRRGTFVNMEYLDPTRVVLHFEMPLAELIVDYFDQLKSRSQGYASMDYEELGYREANLAKVDILVNGEPVDALSIIVHRDRAQGTGRALAERLKQLIPRQMFEIPIQAAIGSNVVARETVRAMRKNVLAKCYGGDISRKRKLLEKQKEGKQRMKRVGSVEIPQEAFLAILRMEDA